MGFRLKTHHETRKTRLIICLNVYDITTQDIIVFLKSGPAIKLVLNLIELKLEIKIYNC